MRAGVLIPMMDGLEDPQETIEFARRMEALGYDHLVGYEHVIGGEPTGRSQTRGNMSHKSFLHEPLTLFAFLGAATTTIEFASEIIITPQRQTVLFAKQAAEVDYLTCGRLRLGLGIGWNPLEFEVLNEEFATRGRRITEQIEVMRALWCEDVVDYTGRWHRIDRAGIMPKPVQQPIPIWLGGTADVVLRRVARIGDGWLPLARPNDAAFLDQLSALRRYVRESGRSEAAVGLEGRINLARGTEEDWKDDLQAWRDLGATHITASTAGTGLRSLKQHVDALTRFRELLRD